ncbi:hypothetical protein Z517_01342 [Fonsecaea pedrosoi CBS 271.37]|uniref:Uncharacterized protein n=1 Tax=Fonsecaea pedrosoi CBS 271.37 TaxID=1442368 RepID=A0A0D2HND8_9EURO|nr:uncharacterized protein Z517_01342 [Fonsecaea pedrosoi CBS 271.37]KIW85949.1 hypothetical protein Z517_01342 [Fonsecaea pedrosoi CBS 271.37]
MEIWRYHPDGWHEPILFTRTRGRGGRRRDGEAIYLGHGVGATFHVPPYQRRSRRRYPRPAPWDYDDDSEYWSDDDDYSRYRRGTINNTTNNNFTRNNPASFARALANNRVVVNNIYRSPRHYY